MKKTDDLIYDLIFSNETYFLIYISDYIEDIYQYEDFIFKLREILKKSKVYIVKNEVLVDSKTVMWELKVRK